MSESRRFDLEIGSTGRDSKVLLDGEIVPRVTKVELVCQVGEPTRIIIHAYTPHGEPYRVSGRMVEDGL